MKEVAVFHVDLNPSLFEFRADFTVPRFQPRLVECGPNHCFGTCLLQKLVDYAQGVGALSQDQTAVVNHVWSLSQFHLAFSRVNIVKKGVFIVFRLVPLVYRPSRLAPYNDLQSCVIVSL